MTSRALLPNHGQNGSSLADSRGRRGSVLQASRSCHELLQCTSHNRVACMLAPSSTSSLTVATKSGEEISDGLD